MPSGSNYFPFFRSYAEYYWRLGTEAQKAEYIDMILAYAFNGEVPPMESAMYGVFMIIRPNIDKSLAHIIAGSAGGRASGSAKTRPGNRNACKIQGPGKQNASKTQAKRKQNATDKEKDKEKENVCVVSAERSHTAHTHRPADPNNAADVFVGPRALRPTLDDVLKVCRNASLHNPSGKTLPEDFGRDFFERMEEAGWTQTNGLVVNMGNLRAVMFSWWRNLERDKRTGSKKAVPGLKLEDSDYDFSKFENKG